MERGIGSQSPILLFFGNTKSFNKKDALIKLNFDNLPVVGETKSKK